MQRVHQFTSAPWPVWRTIEIGRHQSAEATMVALDAANCGISTWGWGILRTEVVFAKEVQKLELVVVTGRELCGDRYATVREIYAAGLARGLRMCPAEVGPALREQYKDQPKGEWLLIAMESIVDSDGRSHVFRIKRDRSGLLLNVNFGRSFDVMPGRRWVFLAPATPTAVSAS